MPGRKPLKEKKKVPITLTVQPELKERMTILSDKLECSISAVGNEAFQDVLEKYQDKGVYALKAFEQKKERVGMLEKDGKDHSGTTILIANHKGGVAKTTTVSALAVLANKDKKRVLVIDIDKQMNLSCLFGFDGSQEVDNIYDYLSNCIERVRRDEIDFETPEKFIQSTPFKNIDIIPGSPFLEDNLSTMLEQANSTLGSKSIFTFIIKDLKALNLYDYIIFDSCPNFNGIVTDVIGSCDWTILTSEASDFSLQGVDKILSYVKRQRRLENKISQVAGILFTRVDAVTSVAKTIPEFKQHYEDEGIHCFNVFIPKSSAVDKAFFMKEPFASRFPTEKVTKKYGEFYRELVSVIG